MKKLLVILGCLAAFASFASGCGSASEPSSASTSVADTSQELTLTEASPEHVRGTFVREGVTLTFDAIKTPARQVFILKGARGQVLVFAQTTPDGRQMDVMDGALSFKTAGTSIKPTTSGDQAGALDKLVNSQEGPIMPWLSQALGARGITGNDYPASFMIHSFGIMMSKAHDITLPPLAQKQELRTKDYYGDTGQYCQAYSNQWGAGCMGMCGPKCNCWHWTCGDCCDHYGCYNHDVSCRSCSWRNPGACASCASFSSFFTGGGCEHP